MNTGPTSSANREVRRLVGVYDAVGTWRGELRYWLRARLGQAHCSLCDITHGAVRERADWRERRATLGVPFETYHLDDQPREVREVAAGEAPVVLADTGDGLVVLLGRDELERCGGSPDHLLESIRAAAAHHGLRWPA